MHKILAIILICSITLPTINMVGTLIKFSINNEYYAKVLCQNKNNPELKCNGKCVLMQKLQMNAEQKQDQNTNRLANTLKEISSFTMAYDQIRSWNTNVNSEFYNSFVFKNLYKHIYRSSVFHPPLI